MNLFIIRVTIPSPPPDRRTKEYKEGTYAFERKRVNICKLMQFESVKAMNDHFAEVYGQEVFLEWEGGGK